jgi:endo-1,4-beta-xylanase
MVYRPLWLIVMTAVLLAAGTVSGDTNILTNPGFETGDTSGWLARYGNTLSVSTTARTGGFSGLANNRTQTWHGIRQSILGLISDGQTCRVSGWIRLANASSASIGLTVQQTDEGGTQYKPIQWSTGSQNFWSYLSGTFTLSVTGQLTTLEIYFEGPPSGVDFYLDDACVEPAGSSDWEAEANARIEQIRKGDFRITALSPYSGQAVSGVAMEIEQIRHHFPFGSAINMNITNPAYAAFFRDHFEWAVMENESKWYANEPSQGQVTYANADAISTFCTANQITMRGHCIFWEAENTVQDWIKGLSYAPLPAASDLRTAVENRLSSAVNHFKGKFVHWDVNNEMCNNSFYTDRLGASARSWMFESAHAIDPDCLLFLNDYNVINGGYNLNAFKQMTYELLSAGTPLHGLGVQCHMTSGFDRETIKGRFDSLEEFGLPVWVTEFDVSDPNEQIRANDLEDFYRIAFSHPSVQGILMWGFWENSHWREDSYLVNADWTLNAAGVRYEALMEEWTTEDSAITDVNGNADFRGFYGTYRVTLTPAGADPTVMEIEVIPGGSEEFLIELTDLPGPSTCTEVHEQGYGLASDGNKDCRVDLKDFEILAVQWLLCNDPENPDCSANW